MLSLLKRLTNLSIVSNVLKSPMDYPDVDNGFERDRRNLCKGCDEVVRGFNRNVRIYGKEYAN
ncbi:hypothetical protein A1D22_05695 [Pasteurellaceae bacterium LFhippo2]|nr:hypothetical protein [Pasteurellaceae bacterium LFhippo2]